MEQSKIEKPKVELTFEQELSVIFNMIENLARERNFSPATVKKIFNVGLSACSQAEVITLKPVSAEFVERYLK